MPLLALEIDDELLGGIVVELDLAESPAPVHHVGVSLMDSNLALDALSVGFLAMSADTSAEFMVA